MSDKKQAPNVSGTFQVADEMRKKDLKDLEKEKGLDEKSLYYARVFMEE